MRSGEMHQAGRNRRNGQAGDQVRKAGRKKQAELAGRKIWREGQAGRWSVHVGRQEDQVRMTDRKIR
jgi:hypothetical protein